MACNLIRNEKGNITNVFLDSGKPSTLFSIIDSIVENKDASYAAYLEILHQQKMSGLGFTPLNEQGQPNPMANTKVMQIITAASLERGMYADKTKQLEHNYRKDLLQESLENFLGSINVTINTVENIHDQNNKKIDVIGQAQMFKRIINVSSGTVDVNTLSEEAAHFTVELLRADMNPLYNSMYRLKIFK